MVRCYHGKKSRGRELAQCGAGGREGAAGGREGGRGRVEAVLAPAHFLLLASSAITHRVGHERIEASVLGGGQVLAAQGAGGGRLEPREEAAHLVRVRVGLGVGGQGEGDQGKG